MNGNLIYLYLLSPVQVLLAELEELDMVQIFDCSKVSRNDVVPLEEAIAEIEQRQDLS